MNTNIIISEEGPGCEVRCVYDWVECVEREDGASICKTRENNCFDDCSQ